MSNVIEHKKFVFANAGINSNKVWEIILFDNDDVEVKFGRIGKTLQSKIHAGVGRKKMDSLIHDKTRPSKHYNGGCYREIQTLETACKTSSSSGVTSKTELKNIAKSQIATCAITQKLIEFLTDVNAHDIYRATGGRISYDASAGTFKTPVGIVTRTNVDSARKILDDLTDLIMAKNFSPQFVSKLEDYLMLIPQDVGRKFDPKAFCGDVSAIQRQSQILDGLEASIRAVLSSTKDGTRTTTDAPPKLFNCELKTLAEKREIDRIQKYFDDGRKSMHASARMRLQQAYIVNIQTMNDAFDKDGAKMTNIHELWHGTSAANLLSILKSGFIIPPSTASHVCGRMFGNGAYFANSSTKSLNYSTGHWGGRDAGRYFMFLCKVALGKFFTPRGPVSHAPPSGHDSYWAKAGQSGVINDEIIVFKTSQIRPIYITEWTK